MNIKLTKKQYGELLNEMRHDNVSTGLFEDEEPNLDEYTPSFTSKDFTDWVDSEFDTEMLEMVKSKIDSRIFLLKTMVGSATRNPIQGYRK
jgi:hypothetical protein